MEKELFRSGAIRLDQESSAVAISDGAIAGRFTQ